MTRTILHIDSSARTEGSVSRDLTASIVVKLGGDVIRRDLKDGLPQVSETWIGANFTPAADRTPEQAEALALSDTLIDELKRADTIVIGAPMYNFTITGALKAWVDLVCRAGETFNYTENGPVGLLNGKRAVIAVTTGGVPVGSDMDHLTGYLRQIMGFIGITDVDVVFADKIMAETDHAVAQANAQIDKLAA
ncbi:FMN-dependent NADH-azoreductase [Sulfitobacter sabulilitoris]|uniref:FMN dependent NADH:quinone oxidoreductase n=1 Tax=Sulfitobacter sabulilitoris TaxID=2562655 RepID=A0A5S3PHY0_9RHOB|nr:NAD(P)H-dependent oxidoreductase [Sulfitobacter sabulilitoris]TMM52951.1 FMN-dependent NADH-azoreductase [Sulfitobacter sabulilitoris]